jgi:signal peptidase I
MSYLLDLVAPGVGHLAARRWVTGALLIGPWLAGLAGAWIAASVDARALLGLPAVHGALAILAVAHLGLARRRAKPEPAGRPETSWRWAVAALPAVWLVAAGLGLALTSRVVRPVAIRSGSMSPTIVTGDVVLVQMFGPALRGLRLGDVILVLHPRHRGRLIVKRIVGLAGDLMQIRGGELRRNGRPVAECELRTLRDHETQAVVVERLEVLEGRPHLVWDQPAVRSSALDVRVPAGHLFVMGDNRDRSGDSRSFGTVRAASVRGLVTTRIAPVLTSRVGEAPLGARIEASRRCAARGRAGAR